MVSTSTFDGSAWRKAWDEDAVAGQEFLQDALQAASADPFRCFVASVPEVFPPPVGSLRGAPFAVKDNITTFDLPTTCGSRLLENYQSPTEAFVVHRLRAQGAVLLGKTNLDEFGMGSSTEHSAFGITRNPWDPDRVPGGSSGGSAAAVAAGHVAFALGSDTGGSIRQPASYCGVVGLKPTYGALSRSGLVAFAASLDQVGILAPDVAQCGEVINVVVGKDPKDSTSRSHPAGRPWVKHSDRTDSSAAHLRIVIPKEALQGANDPDVEAQFIRAMGLWEAAGARVEECSIPLWNDALWAYRILSSVEATSNLARFDGVRYGHRSPGFHDSSERMSAHSRGEGLGREVKRRLMWGGYVLQSEPTLSLYQKAVTLRSALAAQVSEVMDGDRLLLTPTTPGPAFPLGYAESHPEAVAQTDVHTVAANLTGCPALSVPMGEVRGLPIGLQLMAAKWREPLLLEAGALWERIRPPLPSGPIEPRRHYGTS